MLGFTVMISCIIFGLTGMGMVLEKVLNNIIPDEEDE